MGRSDFGHQIPQLGQTSVVRPQQLGDPVAGLVQVGLAELARRRRPRARAFSTAPVNDRAVPDVEDDGDPGLLDPPRIGEQRPRQELGRRRRDIGRQPLGQGSAGRRRRAETADALLPAD